MTESETTEEEFDREELAGQVTGDILKHLVDDAELTVSSNDKSINIHVDTAEPGLIIGRKGSTLDALQFLVHRIVDRKVRGPRIRIEAGGYREQHEEQIVALAHEAAEAARDQGRPQAIENLTSAERRIVHMALKDDESVATESRGEGDYRILIISPASD